MSTFVLIHGAWHGAWCWHKVSPLLQKHGHTVHTLDLPALGVDRTPIQSVSLQSYADRVCETLSACSEPVYLVGHSMGGLAITQAAEAMPQKVRMLVYLTAFLVPSGRTLLDIAQADSEAKVLRNLVFAPDQSSAMVRDDVLEDVFYADCSPADLALVRTLLVPQAAAPFATPILTTPDRWGTVPRVYIECTEDHAISLASQRSMHTLLPCSRVITMSTSHSPFLSAPQELADHLHSL
jgi:pimeloyl-ACP methyl ester carboxylesterase